MAQTLNFSQHATYEEVLQIHENLSTKIVQIQLVHTVKLRIIDRVPEVQ